MNPQIEALSEIIGSCNTKCDHPFDCSHCKAFRVYDAGYRKTSDVARGFFEEIEDKLRGLFDFFRQDDDIREAGAIMLAISEISKLKKKYESEKIQ